MTKRNAILGILLAACLAGPAQAQTEFKPSWVAGVDFRGLLPMGDFSDVASFGVGGTVWGGYSFSPMVTFTARSGYIFTGGKEISGTLGGVTGTVKTNYGIVPVVGGLRFFFTEGDSRVYVAAEAGLFILNGTQETTGSLGGAVSSGSKSESKFGYAPALGAQFRAGRNMMVDARVDYTGIPIDSGDLSWVTFAVGLEWTLE